MTNMYEHGGREALERLGLRRLKVANLLQHVPAELRALGAQGRTAAGHLQVPHQTGFEQGLTRALESAPAPSGLSAKRRPTQAFAPEYLETVPKWHDLAQQFERLPPPASPATGEQSGRRLLRAADITALLAEKTANAGAAAFKRMVRSGGPQVVESAAANPFRPLGKGAVPFVDRSLTANPFNTGFAQARPVPGFGQAGQAALTAGMAGLGGALPPQAVATGAFSKGLPTAARAAPVNPLKARLQAAL